MRTIRLVAGAAIALAGCYSQQPVQPQYPEPMQYSGPPGGQMDPAAQPTYEQYEQDSQSAQTQAYPQAYADPSYAPGDQADDQDDAQGEPAPSADPQDPGYDMGPVSDPEIDATLEGYGQWVDDPDYGRVWRPDATAVGADFTPYETCGSWDWTDWGWSYNCDWNWGWLPFHYGRWGWMDAGYWGWVPGHEWGPGWVDWRHGGGLVGWRPTAPEFHDHRTGHDAPVFHDHRTGAHDSQWRFVSTNEFGKGHIHGHLYGDLAQGLAVTSPVVRPPLRGHTQPIRVSSTMGARLQTTYWHQQHPAAGGTRPVTPGMPGPQRAQQWGTIQRQGQQQWHQPRQPEPTWRAPQTGFRQPAQQGWRQPPSRGQVWSPPPSQHPTWTRPAPSYGGSTYTRPYGGSTYTRPQPSWNAPVSRPSYSPPSRPSYSPPSHSSWSAPSHSASPSYGGGGHSYSGGGGGHSFGGGGHSSGGGGGHHR